MHRTRLTGLTLLEVMITLLILSVGLLSLAALQTRALRLAETAGMQDRAMRLVRDISERMRGNPAGVQHGDYRLVRGQPPAATNGRALADLQAWTGGLAGLPAGSGEIIPCTRTTHIRCAHMDGHLVTVYWNATRDPAVIGYHCPPRTSSDHRCFRQLAP
ncbi:MAG: type IV pilus modification protein PilV [Gammaproteobacteria bacterium]